MNLYLQTTLFQLCATGLVQTLTVRQGCSDDMIRLIPLSQLSVQLIAMPNMPILRQHVSRLTLHMPLACQLPEVNRSPYVHPSQRPSCDT